MASSKKPVQCDCKLTHHAGDIAVVNNALIRKEFISPPKLFKQGHNPKEYIRNIEEFCNAIGISDDDKVYIFVNNLIEEVKFELFALPEYTSHSKSYEWIKKQFLAINPDENENVSPLIELLKCKQGNSSIREFISNLRVRGFKLMGQEDPVKREQFMITALINGLTDRDMAILVKSKKFTTVEEVFNLIKQQSKFSGTPHIQHSYQIEHVNAVNESRPVYHSNVNDVSILRKEVEMLKEQIKYLISLTNSIAANNGNTSLKPPMRERIAHPQSRTYDRLIERRQTHIPPRPNTNDIKCYNCGRMGHSSRQCTQLQDHPYAKDVKCYNCQGMGHFSRQCTQKCGICGDTKHTSFDCQQRKISRQSDGNRFRLLEDIESSSCSFVEHGEHDDDDSGEEALTCIENVMHHEPIHNRKRSYADAAKRKPQVITSRQANDREWADFIEGKRNRPQHHWYANRANKTLITQRRPEKAANKPIIQCSCEGANVKLLLDSGAECNVISEELLYKLMDGNPQISVTRKQTHLRCANGNLMSSGGIAWLTISMGGKETKHPFKIVNGIFPDIIGGIKMMKHCNISIQPANDCVIVDGRRIPFLSKVHEEMTQSQGNGISSILQTANRC